MVCPPLPTPMVYNFTSAIVDSKNGTKLRLHRAWQASKIAVLSVKSMGARKASFKDIRHLVSSFCLAKMSQISSEICGIVWYYLIWFILILELFIHYLNKIQITV